MRGVSRNAMRRSASADRLPGQAASAAALTPAAAAVAPLPTRQRQGLSLRFNGRSLGLRVPSEMWGATALALRLAQPPTGAAAIVLPHIHRSASVIAQAFSAAAPMPPPAGPISEDTPKELAAALDWRPHMGAQEDWQCLLAPAIACAAVYAATAPATVQAAYAACMGLLYLLLVAATRTWLVERRYRAIQRSERQLAAADSRFFHLDGVDLHFKRRIPSAMAATPAATAAAGDGAGVRPTAGGAGGASGQAAAVVHCLHGFGASCYSWSFVQQDLANALHAVVTAHDMPGFGLSQRPRSPKYYTLHFNGDAASAILDAEVVGELVQQERRTLWRRQQDEQQAQQAGVSTAGAEQQGAAELRSHPLADSPPVSRSSSAASLADSDEAAQHAQRPKRILIGHSMGGAAVAEAVIANPEGVDALVLVAPAIVALWMGPPEEADGNPMATGLAVVEEVVCADDAPGEIASPASPSPATSSANGSSPGLNRTSSSSSSNGSSSASAPPPSFAARVQRAARAAAVVAKALLLLVARAVVLAASPLMVLVLRRLVRARRFWERGLASAWYDARKLTSDYVDAYRSGQLVRGWEGGILRFLAARFAEKQGLWQSLLEVLRGEGHLTQAERLVRACRRHNIPVLIVHGAADALVPAANSRRLAALLPGAELAVFEQCGHMPQEECPELFVETVQRFVATLDAQA